MEGCKVLRSKPEGLTTADMLDKHAYDCHCLERISVRTCLCGIGIRGVQELSLIHISEPTRPEPI
eukprot:50550-Pyramimonas_sp.AAC.1